MFCSLIGAHLCVFAFMHTCSVTGRPRWRTKDLTIGPAKTRWQISPKTSPQALIPGASVFPLCCFRAAVSQTRDTQMTEVHPLSCPSQCINIKSLTLILRQEKTKPSFKFYNTVITNIIQNLNRSEEIELVVTTLLV